jgi:hypothetical protein
MNDFRGKKRMTKAVWGPLKRVSVPEYTKMKEFAKKKGRRKESVFEKVSHTLHPFVPF